MEDSERKYLSLVVWESPSTTVQPANASSGSRNIERIRFIRKDRLESPGDSGPSAEGQRTECHLDKAGNRTAAKGKASRNQLDNRNI